jgi:transposase
MAEVSMTAFIEPDYSQQFLLPPALDDWAATDSPVRFLRDFVDALNLKEMRFVPEDAEVGRPAYSPSLLLKIWLYGYLERIRTSRRLERELTLNLELMWLAGTHKPDHNTLWRFWKANRKCLKAVFKKTVTVAMHMGLVDMAYQAIDGTKLASSGSQRNVLFRKKLEARLKELDERIQEIEKAIEQEQRGDATSSEWRLPNELEDKNKRCEKIRDGLRKLDALQVDSLQVTDPEARNMLTSEGMQFGYNAQTVVDGAAGIIVGCDVTQEQSDNLQLLPMIKEAMETVGRSADVTVADAGYFHLEPLAKLEEMGLNVLLSKLPRRRASDVDDSYEKYNFRYDDLLDVFICPQGQPLERSGYEKNDSGQRAPVYTCRHCKDCPAKTLCSPRTPGRRLTKHPREMTLQRLLKKIRSPENIKLLKRRLPVAERPFAVIKWLQMFRRWTLIGTENVKAQWAMVCAACNLKIMARHAS